MKPPEEDRSPIALALAWATRIIGISLVTVVPALLGFGLDQWVGSKVVFTLIGAGLGMALGGWQLAQLVRDLERKRGHRDNQKR